LTASRRASVKGPGARRLIVNADDFGLSAGVTAGILEAHAAGTVTSTSMMVGCPGWDDAARKGRAAPSLGIGLHFNVLVGRPVTSAPSLTDPRTGAFLSLGALVRRALAGRLSRREVAAECAAQVAAIREAGIPVTHIDSHRHTHALPVIRGAVAGVAAGEGLPLRRPVESHRWFPNDLVSQAHRGLISWSWRITSAGAPATRAPDHFIGVSMQGGEHFAGQLAEVLDRLPHGTTEMMVHPGHVDAELDAVDGYTWQRERELAALTSRTVRERLALGDISLVNFARL
jgi:predicted glycoside hydrolase/deacetylase ChbG (UPF0249 family)